METAAPPALDLGGVTVTWLEDIGAMSFAAADLLPEDRDGAGTDLELAFGGYLIATGTENVLVDAGVGDGKARSRPGWDHRSANALPRALERAGVAPADVGTVHLTHLHADHVGWCTRRDGDAWTPVFPRARHQVLAAELRWAGEGAARDPGFLYGSYEDSVRPLVPHGLLDAVDDGHRPAGPIEVRAVPGHTPGSSVVIVRGTRDTAVLSGDLIHHPRQFASPLVCSRFCVDRAASARVRREVLGWVAERDAVLMPAHFGWGRVAAEGDRFRYRPIPR